MSAKQPTKKEHSGGDGADEENDVKYPRETDANEDDDAKDVEDEEEIENEVDEDEEDEDEDDEDDEEDVVCSPWGMVMHEGFVNAWFLF